jgi:toxin ParE1/3/4
VTEKRIERHSSVIESDLPGIYAFIAKNDPTAAERVLDAIEDTFQQIARHPECGMTFRTRNAKLQGLRIFPVKGFQNYLVFYRNDGESVRILYVVHGARHLLRLFKHEPRE